MNLITRGEYNNINEAVIGLRRLASKEDLETVNDQEFNEMIKFLLLLNNQTGARLCESHYTIIKELMIKSDLVNESRFESMDSIVAINENYINEDWDDDVSTGIKTAAVTTGAAAVSLAAYISFLFKKKKIRKAWEAVKDKELEAVAVDKDLADTIKSYEPELSKEEVTDKISDIEKKKDEEKTALKDFDVNKKEEVEKTEDKLKKTNDAIRGLDSSEAPKEGEEETVEPVKGPTGGTESGGTGGTESGGTESGGTATNKNSNESTVIEADGDAKEDEATGQIPDKKKEIKDIKDNSNIEADIEKIKKESQKIEDKNKKLKDDGGKNVEKQLKKNSDLKKKNSEKIKELEEEGTPELKKAKDDLKVLNTDLEKEKKNRDSQKETLKSARDEEAIKKEKEDLKANIKSAETEIKDIKEKGKPRGTDVEKKQAIDDATKQKEQIALEVEAAKKEADRISGTSGGGESAKGVGGKIFGFSSGYVQQLKGEHAIEVLQAKKDALTTNDTISDKDKAAQEKGLDAQIEKSKESIKSGEKTLKSATDGVDASDDEIKQAEDSVDNKQKEQEAEKTEKESKDKANKKEAIDDEIERINKKIDGAKKALDGDNIPAGKRDMVQSNIDAFNDKKEELRKMKDKLGESTYYKFNLALLERDIDTLLNEYNIILETRKELLEEEPSDTSDTKDDESGNDKSDKSNSLEGKKVVLVDMRIKDLGALEGASGEIIKAFKENEREPEGDLPRRTGDPELFKIKLDKPKDPMYPEINLTKKHFKLKEDKPESKEKKTNESINESFRQRFYNAYNDSNKEI